MVKYGKAARWATGGEDERGVGGGLDLRHRRKEK